MASRFKTKLLLVLVVVTVAFAVTSCRSADALVKEMDEGMDDFYAGEYSRAIQHLSDVEALMSDRQGKSKIGDVSKLVLNDNAVPYSGEIYEDVVLNSVLALSYYRNGSLEDALVEIRKVDSKLKEYLDNTEKQEGWLYSLILALTPTPWSLYDDIPSGLYSYNDSPLANYISMVLYRADGSTDDAFIDFKDVASALYFPKSDYIARLKGEKSFNDDEYIRAAQGSSVLSLDDVKTPAGKARLNIISFEGLISPKVERFAVKDISIYEVDKNGNFTGRIVESFPARVAWPEIADFNESKVTNAVVTVRNKAFRESFTLGLLENFSEDARNALGMKIKSTYLRSYYRSTSKMRLALGAYLVADRAENKDAGAFLQLLSLGAMVAINAAEQADLRMCTNLPDKVTAGGITLDPGEYEVVVDYYSGKTKIQSRTFDISLKSGQSEILVSTCTL